MNITIGGILREVTDKQLEQIHKLLESELRTPDDIQFRGGMADGFITGLFFNKGEQILGFHEGQWTVYPSTSMVARTDRKLVPVEREYLKPGDMAYRDIEKKDTGKWLNSYCIILDNESVACVEDKTDVKVDDDDYEYWWRVM